jgi:hypothetical protein
MECGLDVMFHNRTVAKAKRTVSCKLKKSGAAFPYVSSPEYINQDVVGQDTMSQQLRTPQSSTARQGCGSQDVFQLDHERMVLANFRSPMSPTRKRVLTHGAGTTVGICAISRSRFRGKTLLVPPNSPQPGWPSSMYIRFVRHVHTR